MLTPVIVRDTINREATLIDIADITTVKGAVHYKPDESGLMQPVTSTDGFGAPDPTRDQLAWICLAVQKTTCEDLVRFPKPYLANSPTAKIATFDYLKDGWWQFYSFYFPLFDAGATYTENDKVFHVGTEQPYGGEVKEWIGGAWVEVELATLVKKEVYNLLPYRNFIDDFLAYKTGLEHSELVEKRDILRRKDDCCKDLEYLRKKIYEYSLTLKAACNASSKGYLYQAQEIIEGLS